MSAQPKRQTIRLRCDETSRAAVLDLFTNGTPTAYARAATDFQVEFVSGGVLDDVSNLSSVTLETAPYSNRDAARKMSKTIAGSALDNTLTDETWDDGSQQHAVFSFSSAEMNIALGGGTSQDLWLVISAITTAGDPIVYATGKLVVTDPGTFNAAPPPPDNPGAGITIDQADVRYPQVAAVAQYLPHVRFLALGSSGGTPTNNLSHVATDPRNVGDVVSFRLTASPHQLTFASLESGAVDPDDDTQVGCSDDEDLHWQLLVTAPPVESAGAVTNPRVARVETNGDDATASIGGSPYASEQAAFDAVQAATGPMEIYFGVNPALWGTINAPNGVRDGIVWTGAGRTLSRLTGITVNGSADVHLQSDRSVDLGVLRMLGTPGVGGTETLNYDGDGNFTGPTDTPNTAGDDCGSLNAAGCLFSFQIHGGDGGQNGSGFGSPPGGGVGAVSLTGCDLNSYCNISAGQAGGDAGGPASGDVGAISVLRCSARGNFALGVDARTLPSVHIQDCASLVGDLTFAVVYGSPGGYTVSVVNSHTGSIVTAISYGYVSLACALVQGGITCWNLYDAALTRSGPGGSVVTGSIIEFND